MQLIMRLIMQFHFLTMALLLALGWIAPSLGNRAFRRIESKANRIASRRGLMVLTIGVAVILVRSALLPWMPAPFPSVHDEFSYLFAGDTYAHGRLANPTHPMWVYFETFHELSVPTRSSFYPPAQGALLALGELLGKPWFGVLFSAGLMCGAILWALQGWLPPGWALLGGVIAALRIGIVGDWVNSYWGGAPAAIGGALVIGAYPRMVRKPCVRYSLLLGLGAAILANSRPLEGFIFCVPVAIALMHNLASRLRNEFRMTMLRVVTPLAAVFVILIAFIGYNNWRVTRDPFVLPEQAAARQYSNYPIFLFQKIGAPLHYRNAQFEHFYNEVIPNANPRSWSWSVLSKSHKIWSFFLGTILSLPLIMVPYLLKDGRTRLLVLQFAISFGAALTVSWSFPHYFAPLTATIFILAMQLMRHLRQWEPGGKPVGVYLTRLVLVLALIRPFVVVGYAAEHPTADWRNAREKTIEQLEANPGKQLVLVSYRPNHTVEHEWVYNAADIDHARIVWARVIAGRDLAPLLTYFKDRTIWVLDPDAAPPKLQPYPGSLPLTNTQPMLALAGQTTATGR